MLVQCSALPRILLMQCVKGWLLGMSVHIPGHAISTVSEGVKIEQEVITALNIAHLFH